MKLESESSDTIIIGKVQKGEYKMGDLTKIFSILHTQIYSDKILAPIRELVCNAHDSHVAAKTNRRFQIHMPTQDACYFSIRDFGTGMTEEEVIELYTTYGASTKDNSNEAVGCFGIGSKAPFAYTDRFEVTAFKDGRMNVYQCLVDEGVPKFIQYDSTDTDEPNGMLIKFDVNQYDKYAFRTAMEKMLFFQDEIEFVDDAYISFAPIPKFDSDFALYNQWGVEMGGVLYPISRADLDQVSLLLKLDETLGYGQGYIIHVELGDVDITASRETINWTSKSKECLKRKAKYLIDNAESMCRREMMGVKTLWAKLDVYAQFLRRHPFLSKIRSIWAITNRLSSSSIWGNRDKVSIVYKGYSNSTKAVKTLLETAQNKLTVCSPCSNIKFVDITENKKPSDGIREYSAKHTDYIIVCVKDEEVLKFLERLKAPVRSASEFDMYKPVRTPKSKRQKIKTESTDLVRLLSGVRQFVGLGRAPKTVPAEWFNITINNPSYKEIYYVLRDSPHSKFCVPDMFDHICNDEDLVTWYTFFSSFGGYIYVISPKVIDKLKQEDSNHKLINIEEKIKSVYKNKDALLREYRKYKVLFLLMDHYHEEVVTNVVNQYVIAALKAPRHRELFKSLCALDKKFPQCPLGLIERTVFRISEIDLELRRSIREVVASYQNVLSTYFPLLAWKDYTTRPADKVKDHVLQYCKMARKEMLADAKKAAKAEETKNAENN